MIIAELTLQIPVLEDTLDKVPEMSIDVERERSVGDGETIQLLFWAHGDDHERFEAEMEDDCSIGTYEQLTKDDDRRLYRVTYAEDVAEISSNPIWVELDAMLLEAVGSNEGWDVRFQFPDREAFVDWWESHYDSITVDALYSSSGETGAETKLTALQRETLGRALETGYFEVPRQTTLDDLANEFDISAQALSVRLRKGTATVIEDALTDEGI